PFAQQRLGFCHDYMDGHRFLFLQAQPRPRRSERKPLLPLAAALWPTAYAQYIVLLARIYSQKYFNGKKAFTSSSGCDIVMEMASGVAVRAGAGRSRRSGCY